MSPHKYQLRKVGGLWDDPKLYNAKLYDCSWTTKLFSDYFKK